MQLQNFANWYSYYSHRMIMMKTGAGIAFKQVGTNYRVGFMSMKQQRLAGLPGGRHLGAAQKALWYGKLYGAQTGQSTPLREALSHLGQYYAHLYGSVSKYKTTITVSGSGSTGVTSIKVNGFETLADTVDADTNVCVVANNIANQINAPAVTDYGATVGTGASCNVVTITGPSSAVGFTPSITKTPGGTMTFSTTAFTTSTTSAQINGVTPPDPIQYSCQQNFTLLSTDGYWNGSNNYDLGNDDVGNPDGLTARPFYDGTTVSSTFTTIFTRDSYSATGTALSGGTNCSSGRSASSFSRKSAR